MRRARISKFSGGAYLAAALLAFGVTSPSSGVAQDVQQLDTARMVETRTEPARADYGWLGLLGLTGLLGLAGRRGRQHHVSHTDRTEHIGTTRHGPTERVEDIDTTRKRRVS